MFNTILVAGSSSGFGRMTAEALGPCRPYRHASMHYVARRNADKVALPQSVWRRGSILALNSSGPARPYMARLRVFRRLI